MLCVKKWRLCMHKPRSVAMVQRGLMLSVALAIVAAQSLPAEPLTLKVWTDKAPGETGQVGPEQLQPEQPGQRKVARLTNVSEPTIAVYLPPEEKRSDAAVVICPGGGYRILAMDLEGTEV